MSEDTRLVFIVTLLIVVFIVVFAQKVDETQTIKIGVLTSDQRRNASEVFLAELAIVDVNQYCMNNSIPIEFIAVPKYANGRAQQAIEMTDEFHSEDVSILVGYMFGSMLDACDYQSKNYGMVIISPESTSALHRDVYQHIIQLKPVTIHEAQAIARTMIELGFSETVVFMENTETHTGYLVDEFELYYEMLGGNITETIRYYVSTNPEYINQTLSKLENSIKENTAIFFPDASPYTAFYQELNDYPRLLNTTWFASSEVNSNYTAMLSVTPEMAQLKLIHTVLDESPDSSNPRYREINSEYSAEFGENLYKYKGNIYDAVWLSALTMIEIGEYTNTSFIEAFQKIANNYTGVSGDCSLDQYGDRLYGNYHIYRYVLRDQDVYLNEIGYLETSKPEITWLE